MRASRIVVAVIVLVAAAVIVVAAGASPRTDLATVAAPDSTSIALRYAPTWLPDGFVERTRSLSTAQGDRAASYSRQWGTRPIDDDSDPNLAMGVNTATDADTPYCTGGQPYDFDGAPALYRRWDTYACIDWQIDPKTRVSITLGGAGVDLDDTLRVARSVRPVDGNFVVPLHLRRRDFLYGDSPDGGLSVTGTSPTDWTVQTIFNVNSKTDPRALYITLGTKADVPPNGDTSYVVVEVRPGLLLTVHHWWPQGTPLPATELSKMADRIRVSTPDMSWIGTRQL